MLPRHIAVIMDGNGRWAKKRGLARTEGHKAGTRVAKRIVERCRELGVEYVTLYTFSKENWARPKDEVSFLFDLLARFLKGEVKNLVDQDIRLNVLGEVDELPLIARKAVEYVMDRTSECGSMVLNLALNYSSRHEILQACKALAQSGLEPDAITGEEFEARLSTHGQPDPDLVIRTSGEQRLSNFLMYQIAYSELYFTDTLWPDFTSGELEKAIEEFGFRQRRFGKVEE